MSAARHLPDNALWTIGIQSSGAVPSSEANMKIGSLDTVAFTNGATFPVDIVMTNTLTSITDLRQGANSGAQGGSTSLNVTLNYTIWNHNTGLQVAGPYSIQFGIGPLPISIESLETAPDPIAVPSGGQIRFTADVKYDIEWKINSVQANVWSPQPLTVSAGQNQAQTALPGANGKTLTYSISDATNTRGGGTVQVGT